jgi:hypothetical protein
MQIRSSISLRNKMQFVVESFEKLNQNYTWALPLLCFTTMYSLRSGMDKNTDNFWLSKSGRTKPLPYSLPALEPWRWPLYFSAFQTLCMAKFICPWAFCYSWHITESIHFTSKISFRSFFAFSNVTCLVWVPMISHLNYWNSFNPAFTNLLSPTQHQIHLSTIQSNLNNLSHL